ncbi:hypothetical protein DE146DRAFT_676056 [Phaeosphaeria sp. MPI-PUGE-AT-0046c]|nr:hypothetical protein DE146DRAFT_676056 [Phaeosphaeria sp. MPI-PUGE-AT-0046c]
MPPRKALRRPHKKSRLGCEECKRRHVKVGSLRSSPTPVLRSSLSTAADSTVTTPVAILPSSISLDLLSSQSTPSLFTAFDFRPDFTTTPSGQNDAFCSPLNMHHMELFSQFIFETGPSVYEGGSIDNESFRAIMPAALSAPYAMYQMLALSALHLSHTRTAQASHYREEATFLQTEALSLFNDSWAEITTENCVPMLLFSSLLSLHTLGEAVIASETDAGGFLNRFVTHLNLHRGVRAVSSQSWQMLSKSNISSILDRTERALHATSLQSQEQATFVTNRLHNLLKEADMGPESEQACREAVESLQLIYQSESLIGESSAKMAPGSIWTWPILLSAVFTDLVMKRRPEALIILCHYAVLLHRRRHIWLVRNAGQMLISEITRYLGTYWSDWLDWPNQMLQDLL